MASVKITGLDRVQKALLRVTEESQRTMKREIRRSALDIQAGAKTLTPVDTGRLRNSISGDYLDDGYSAVIGTNVEYAPHVEFGTSRMPARPYLFPAYESEWPQFIARLRHEFGATTVRVNE